VRQVGYLQRLYRDALHGQQNIKFKVSFPTKREEHALTTVRVKRKQFAHFGTQVSFNSQ